MAVEQDAPEPVPQRRAAGVAARDDVESPLAEPVRQPRRLGRLAAAVRAVQDQEESRMGMDAPPGLPNSAGMFDGPP